MNHLLVSSEELSSHSAALSSMSVSLQELFGSIQSDMNQLSAVWTSPASQALQSQFESLIPVFRQYCHKLDNYAQYLQSTSSAYSENEQMLQKAASL